MKNMLVITQKVDERDPILGFFCRWVEEFSKEFGRVKVICLEEGSHTLPANVEVFSLGKEKGVGRLAYLRNFYGHIWSERKNYDVVFVHMNPVYVILGWVFWKVWNKKISLWYTHKKVDLKLRLAEMFADIIFTASKDSFRLKSSKVLVVGHGIDIKQFSATPRTNTGVCRILSVSRISQVKNQLVMIQAVELLCKGNFPAKLIIVGAGVTEDDKRYEEELKKYVSKAGLSGRVEFVGNIAPSRVAQAYQGADIFINLSNTGSLDKAILEAMATGMEVLTSNEAFKEILSDDNFTTLDPQEIAQKITALSLLKDDGKMQAYVAENHNIERLVPRLSNVLKKR